LFEVNFIGGQTGDGEGIGVAVFFTFFFFFTGFLVGFLVVDETAGVAFALFEPLELLWQLGLP